MSTPRSAGFYSAAQLALMVAASPAAAEVLADRMARLAGPEGEGFADSTSDPVADLRRAIEQMKAKTGQKAYVIAMSAASISRIIDAIRSFIADAERKLGIGYEPEGKFPAGRPWHLRKGRPSREEKRLRDSLPGWRNQLAVLAPAPTVTSMHKGAVGPDFPMVIRPREGDGVMEVVEGSVMGLTNPDLPTGGYMPSLTDSRRRSTGKRAQRRMAKPWAGRK